MADSKDWIVRFYASHDSIPEGHHDGEIVRELIRCMDCKKYNPNAGDNEETGHCNMLGSYRVPRDGYCAWAERKTE